MWLSGKFDRIWSPKKGLIVREASHNFIRAVTVERDVAVGVRLFAGFLVIKINEKSPVR